MEQLVPRFEAILGNLQAQDFFSQYYGKLPFALPDAAGQFVGMLGWSYLGDLFQKGHDDCWLAKKGHLLSAGGTLGSLAEVRHAFYNEGASLLVRHVERVDPFLAALARSFEQTFEKPVDVHIYATPAGYNGFDWHYDIEEVFAIQSTGKKEFTIRQNTINPRPTLRPLPKDLHFERETSNTQLRCLLAAGDWLYMPAGWWHKAEAVTDSFHLSIGIMAGPDDPKKRAIPHLHHGHPPHA